MSQSSPIGDEIARKQGVWLSAASGLAAASAQTEAVRSEFLTAPTMSTVKVFVVGQAVTTLVEEEGVRVGDIMDWLRAEEVMDVTKIRVILEVPTDVTVETA